MGDNFFLRMSEYNKDTVKNYLGYDVICQAAEVQKWSFEYINQFTSDKTVVEIGSGIGLSRHYIRCKKLYMSDPYSNATNVIQSDGDEFIKSFETKSIGCCFGLFCLHYLSQDFSILRDRLENNGIGIFINISEKSKLFNNNEFNKLFFKYGFNVWKRGTEIAFEKNIISKCVPNKIWSHVEHEAWPSSFSPMKQSEK